MYKRITNIAEKIKDARLKIDEWKVLFAVDNNSNPQKIADFLEISLEKVNDALAHLAEEGFVASGEEAEVVEDQAETEVAPMKMEPEKQAEELVEEKADDEESVLEEIVAEEESEAADIIEEIVEEPTEETILEETSDEQAEKTTEEVTLEDLVEEVAEEETIIEDEIDEAKEDVSLDEIIPAEEESIIEEEKDTEEGLVLDDFIDDKTETAPEEVTEEVPPEEDKKKDSAGAKKIMVVDDSIVIRKMVEIALENENYTIESAVSGKEALKKVDAIEPDLVILDIMLPDVSGIEILKAIKASKGIPVIMLSGKNSPQDIELAKAQGADDFAPKPFKEEELVEKIKALL